VWRVGVVPQEFQSIFSDERPALAEIEIKVLREEVELFSVLNHPKVSCRSPLVWAVRD
jgi:hypothetical protein